MHSEARAIFDDMQKSGCPPNVVTYTSLMHSYINAGLALLLLSPTMLSYVCMHSILKGHNKSLREPGNTLLALSFVTSVFLIKLGISYILF